MKIVQTLTPVLLVLSLSFISNAQNIQIKDNVPFNKDSVYSQSDVDVKAEYPGGEKAWRDYIEKNVDGTVAAVNRATFGKYTVIIICIIDINGKIIAAVPETSHGYGMEKEVLRVINKLPKAHMPAIKNGIAVKSKIKLPFMFWISSGKEF